MIEIYEEEFNPDPILDDDRLYTLKKALMSLRPVERKIFLTYVESGTYSETARQYHVSVPTAKRYLIDIKNKLIEMMEDDIDDVDADGHS